MITLIPNLIIIAALIVAVVLCCCYRKKIQRFIDKAISESIWSQITLLGLVTGVVFVVLFLIMWWIHRDLKLEIFDAIFAFINPGSIFSEPVKDTDKLWAIILGFCGMILLGGLLISVFNNILGRRVETVKNGKAYYNFDNHIVIIGYDKMVIDLVVQLSTKYPSEDIIIQTLQKVPKVRHELFSKLPEGVENKITIISGNRTALEDLEKLYLHKAQELFILGESDEQDRDSLNIESLKKINKFLKENKATPDKPCYVLFENQSTYAVLQQQDLDEFRVSETNKITYLNFYPFNISELWALKLFVDCKYDHREDGLESVEYCPLDRDGIDYDSENTVHLVILGMSKIGVALGIQASHLCHFPNFIRDKKLKTRITFIDENADREMYFLQGRYQHLFNEINHSYEDIEKPEKNHNNNQSSKFTDIEWHFIKGRVEHFAIREKLKEYSNEKDTYLTIAVCFGSLAASIACGLYLPDEVNRSGAQILVRQDTPYSILSMLKSVGKYGNIKPFGMTNLCLNLLKDHDISPMIVNYIYSHYYDNVKEPETIPHISELKKSWKTLKMVKKWSNRYNANMLAVKQRSFDLRQDKVLDEKTVDLLSEVEHNRWNIEELLLGFRPTTSDEKKEIGTDYDLKEEKKKDFIHNDICPYHDISDVDIEPEKPNGNKIKNTREYDICLSKAIPMILKYIEDNK